MTIDLNECEKGDILICKHGVIKEYVGKTDKNSSEGYYDHKVKYLYIPNIGFLNSEGTVCNDGFVFRYSRLETDTDVIKIVKRNVFKRYLRFISQNL